MINFWKSLTTPRLRRESSPASSINIYREIFKFIDKNNPGRGKDFHTQNSKADWPSAYALIASAELSRFISTGAQSAAVNHQRSVRWLIENSGCATTGAPNWGVPYARKIWEDTKPVAPGTAFTIPTAHAIQALCEAATSNLFDRSERQVFLESAAQSATYLATHCFDEWDDGIVFWYSPLKQHSFHVTNATAMLAGQLQRVSYIAPEKKYLSEQADRAIKYLLNCRRDQDKGFGWFYFGDKKPPSKNNRTNDLLHDTFVCHGLLDYKRFGGKFGNLYSYESLYYTIKQFYRDAFFYEYPEVEEISSRKKHLARVWALGHSLYVTALLEERLRASSTKFLSENILRQLRDNYFQNGRLYYRPNGEDISERVREVGHVLLGLSQHGFILSQKK